MNIQEYLTTHPITQEQHIDWEKLDDYTTFSKLVFAFFPPQLYRVFCLIAYGREDHELPNAQASMSRNEVATKCKKSPHTVKGQINKILSLTDSSCISALQGRIINLQCAELAHRSPQIDL